MCGYCGCSTPVPAKSHGHEHSHGGEEAHHHDHHHHHHGDEGNRVIELSREILDKNARLAERARGLFLGKAITALNLVSSPGSGKTALLEKTATRLQGDLRCGVIVGDCATDNDAQRLRANGIPAVQVTTGNVCHLDAHMVLHGIEDLGLNDVDLLLIENVGNLVCPAAFDLGEDRRIVLMSVTEGEDKPQKYPTIFLEADAVVLTKTDLAEAVEFDRETALANIRDIAPKAQTLEVSSKTGVGMDGWLAYLDECVAAKRAVAV